MEFSKSVFFGRNFPLECGSFSKLVNFDLKRLFHEIKRGMFGRKWVVKFSVWVRVELVNLPSLISDPSCVSSDKLISIFELGKTGALSFKSSISSSTLNNLKRLCGFVIISASKMQSGDSRRPHSASRSIGMRVRKSPLFSSISSRSKPFII